MICPWGGTRFWAADGGTEGLLQFLGFGIFNLQHFNVFLLLFLLFFLMRGPELRCGLTKAETS